MSKIDEMQNLVDKIVQTIPSYEVAEMMQKDHKEIMWMIDGNEKRGIIGIKPTLEISAELHLSDYFISSTYKDSMNREKPCYECTKLGCDMLANKMTGEKGILFTAKYVKRFEQMEQYIKEQQVPQLTEKQMLQLKILNGDEMERIGALKRYEGVIKKPLIDTIEKQSEVIEYMKPAVTVKEALDASVTSVLIRDFAKTLKQNGIDTGEKRLFEWMRENGYLIKRKGADYNMPTQKAMDLGLFEVKQTNIVHSNGLVTTSRTPKITGKGQVYFINKFIKPKETSLIESLSK